MKKITLFLVMCSGAFAQTTQEEWQRMAVKDYPELGVKGSDLNRLYLEKVRSLRQKDPSFFEDPRWPYAIAEEIGNKAEKEVIIPGLEEVEVIEADPQVAYVEGQQVEVVQAKDVGEKGMEGQKICIEGVVLGASQRTMDSKDIFFIKLSPNIYCEFSAGSFLTRNSNAIPRFSPYLASDGKIVIENNAVSVLAPPARDKKAVKVGQVLTNGEKVLVYGKFTGLGSIGVDRGFLIKDCVLALGSQPRNRR